MLNIKYCKLVYVIFTLIGITVTGVCKAESSNVITSTTNNRDYHHLKYTLSKENIISVDLLTKEQFVLRRGQFEVLLKKAEFPIDAPYCKSDLILRMPGTDPDYVDSKMFVEEKFDIYNAIRNIQQSEKNSSKDIYVELNPYVKIKNGEFQLTQCNIFFRQAYGRYIPQTGEK
jgi:hypothetical protein